VLKLFSSSVDLKILKLCIAIGILCWISTRLCDEWESDLLGGDAKFNLILGGRVIFSLSTSPPRWSPAYNPDTASSPHRQLRLASDLLLISRRRAVNNHHRRSRRHCADTATSHYRRHENPSQLSFSYSNYAGNKREKNLPLCVALVLKAI